jgi:hypothetical protein
MALIKGRFIEDSSVDGAKVKLKNQQPLKGKKSDGSDKDILQISSDGKIQFLDLPVVSADPVSADEVGRKGYVDAQAQSAKDYADGKVAQEAADRAAADAEIDARIDTLEADAVTKAYVDTKDAEGKAYADQKIADLVNSAPSTLDTLKELADAIAAGETASQGLLTLIGQTDAKVDAEILNRQSADQVLDDKVDQEIADRQAADAALDLRLDVLEADPVTKSYVDQKDADLAARVSAMEAYDKETVYVDSVNGVDEAGRGTMLRPFKTINFAYGQVQSAATDLTKWASEKLILSLAAGNYSEEVVIGFKRARVAVVGDGVFISGGLTVKMLKEDTPTITAGGLPSPWTGDNVRATFEMVGTGGGMEGGYVSKNIIVNGQVKLLSESWANASSWQFGGALSHYVFMSNVQLRAGLISVHDSKSFTGTVGPNITAEIDSSSIEGGYFGAQPLTAGANMLTATNHQFNIKAHNSQLKSTIGPRAVILEIDGCRVMNIDRTMGGAVAGSQDAAGVTAQDSSSYSGIVNSPFAGTVYKLGRTSTAGNVTFRMDANSYASLKGKTIDAGASTLLYNLIDKASAVAVQLSATNYVASEATVESHLSGIHSALATKANASDVTASINAEQTARQAADSAEASARQAADTALDARLTVLEADPTTKTYVDGKFNDAKTYTDAGVAEAKGYADQKVAALVNGAPEMLDTLKELADALQAQSGDLSSSILSQVGAVDQRLTNEIADRVSGDQALRTDLNAEISARESADLEFLKLDGSRPMGAQLDMGGHDIKNASGVMIGYNAAPAEKLHIVDGNQLIEGSGETSIVMKRAGLVGTALDPIFKLGRIVAGGILKPVYRILYQDAEQGERSVFEVESTGTVASVSDGTRRSHFEAYVNNGDTEPVFRLNSHPDMGLELGAGGTTPVDVALRRNGAQSAKLEIGGDAKTIWYADNVVIQGGAGLVMSGQRVKDVGAPSQDTDAATKAYVDGLATSEAAARQSADAGLQTAIDAEAARALAAETALDARIDTIEAHPIYGKKELKTLASGDLSYVDCAVEALADTMIVSVSGVMHYEGDSYSVSVVDGKTRITWVGDLASGGAAALTAGDRVLLQYLTHAPSSGGGGGGEVPVAPVVQSVTVLPQSELYSAVQVAWTGTATNYNILKYGGPEFGWELCAGGPLSSSSPATITDLPRPQSWEPDENANFRMILDNNVEGVPHLSQAFDFSLPKRASGGDPEAEIPASGQVISGLNVENNGITFTNVEFIKLFFPGTTDEITQSSKVRISYTSPVPLENMYLEFFINGQWTETYNQGRPDGLTSSPMTANITRGYSYRLKLKNSSGVESGVLEFNVGY